MQSKRAASADGSDIPAIPVTVRQLEAVIRISESLAKMNLQVGPVAFCAWSWPQCPAAAPTANSQVY